MGVVRAAYASLIAEGVITDDPAQDEAVSLLDNLSADLVAAEKAQSGLSALFKRAKPVSGAYVWGDVGRGKTMLMDLFFENVPITRKRRVHYHEFMDEMHEAIAAYRAETADSTKGRRDPIPTVTKPLIESTKLLCLDEFHVNDITNAMLLGRLFEHLFAAGVVLVATSNVEPGDLYRDGLNRQLFLPFIDLLRERTTVFELVAETDYRRLKLAGQRVFAFGAPEKTRAAMDDIWQRLTGGQSGSAAVVTSLGREIAIPRQAMGTARFSFAELCEAPLGARDYLRLAHAYHSFILDDVPQLGRTRSDAAQRFILLVDTLYDRGVKLAAGFEVPLDELGRDDKTAFAFQRCVSRLTEMQSEAYLAQPVREPEPA